MSQVMATNEQQPDLESEDLKNKQEEISDNMDTFSGSEDDEDDGSWIQWYCHIKGHEFFSEVDEEYIQDDFNLTGLMSWVPYYDNALDVILDIESPNEDLLSEQQHQVVEGAAEMLYGLIHARYILTTRGMHAMLAKYRNAEFGRCPNVFCQGQPALPLGLSDIVGTDMVKIWCPKCESVYFPKSSRMCSLDGAYFGTTFAHLFVMQHPELVPAAPAQAYVPKVYGFKIHKNADCVKLREHVTEQQRLSLLAESLKEAKEKRQRKQAKGVESQEL